MKNYINLLKEIKENGTLKISRAGDTKSVFGRQLRWNMQEGFPLMTAKKISFHNIAHELLWFLNAIDDEWKVFGNTNIRYLVDHGVHIWDDDAYRGYVEEMQRGKHGSWLEKDEFIDEIKNNDKFALKYGELGETYGAQWRRWDAQSTLSNMIGEVYDTGVDYGIDQISKVIKNIKNNPNSRRHRVTAWNPSLIDSLTLPPCHYGFTLNVQPMSHGERCELFGRHDNPNRTEDYGEWLDENGFPKTKLSLIWNQRSVDTFLGLPYNIASYALLLRIISYFTNMVPNELVCSLEDTHIYMNQMDAVDQLMERRGNTPELPTIELVNMKGVESIDDIRFDNFRIKGYHPLKGIKAPLSVGL